MPPERERAFALGSISLGASALVALDSSLLTDAPTLSRMLLCCAPILALGGLGLAFAGFRARPIASVVGMILSLGSAALMLYALLATRASV